MDGGKVSYIRCTFVDGPPNPADRCIWTSFDLRGFFRPDGPAALASSASCRCAAVVAGLGFCRCWACAPGVLPPRPVFGGMLRTRRSVLCCRGAYSSERRVD